MSTTEVEQHRHASWAELFFDLVVVAGVGLLAHVVQVEVTPEALGLYAVLFLAFWLCWTSFMLYGNVAAGSTHVLRLLVGMVGIGVMVASVPGISRQLLEGHPEPHVLNAFAVAYVATRVYGAQSWRRGEVLLDFPVAQHTVGVLPWVVSLWVDEPWKVVLWAVGIALDLVLVLVVSGDEMLGRYEERLAQDGGQRRGRASRRGDDGPPLVLTGVSVDPAHLAERLGLFVIIVLGEGVIQVLDAASEAPFTRGLLSAGVVSFVLLAGMFGLSVVYGFAGLPHLRPGSLETRPGLALHCAVTGTIAALSVAVARVVEDGSEPLPDDQRWLLCGAVAVYFALGLVGVVVSRGFRPTAVVPGLVAGVAIPLLLGVFADDARGTALVAYVALVVLGHLAAEHRAARGAAA